MEKKKELSIDELETVNGGCYGLTDPKTPTFSGYLNMYSLEEKKEYFFVYLKYDKQYWIKGKVLRTWEEEGWFNFTTRKHRIEITHTGSVYNANIGDVIELIGDNTAAYTKRG